MSILAMLAGAALIGGGIGAIRNGDANGAGGVVAGTFCLLYGIFTF